MIVKIDSVLKSQNKSRHWLSEETGITYANICKLCNGRTGGIQFDNLEKICSVLKCSVSDILEPEYFETNRIIVYQNKIKKNQ